jgi:hypothetical protein
MREENYNGKDGLRLPWPMISIVFTLIIQTVIFANWLGRIGRDVEYLRQAEASHVLRQEYIAHETAQDERIMDVRSDVVRHTDKGAR